MLDCEVIDSLYTKLSKRNQDDINSSVSMLTKRLASELSTIVWFFVFSTVVSAVACAFIGTSDIRTLFYQFYQLQRL